MNPDPTSSRSPASHTDVVSTGWVRHMPTAVRPYLLLMRLDRPIGTWLLLLPGWWAIIAGAGGLSQIMPHHWETLALFGLGAIIMRGAGCVINDLWDRDFDRQVERTKSRPLAAGTISPRAAYIFLAILLLLGLLILMQFNTLTILIGCLSLIPVVLYPLAKRVTGYPQAVLGLTFNIGALMGAAAVTETLPLWAMLLYAAGFFWTMGYDTIYAHQDKSDDALIGVRSTALTFGTCSTTYIAVFYTLTALLIFMAGFVMELGPVFYLFWAISTGHLLRQIYLWQMDDPANCLNHFRSNRDFGFLIALGFLLGSLF